MNDTRFVNPHQPQTLYMGVILCYIDAVFGLLGAYRLLLPGLFVIVGLAVGGYGIANEKKWGYNIAVAAAVLQVVVLFWLWGFEAFAIGPLISLGFDAALVALLLHPMSRDYQRIWFR